MKKSMKGRFSLMILRSFAAILTAAVPFVACNDSFETEVPDGGNSGQTPGTGDGGGEEPEAPEPHFYQEVTASLADWSGDYLICADHSDAMIVFADWSDETYGQPAYDDAGDMVDLSVFVTEDGIPAEDGDPYKSVVTAVGEYYSVYVSNVGYIGHSGGGNTLTGSGRERRHMALGSVLERPHEDDFSGGRYEDSPVECFASALLRIFWLSGRYYPL